MNVARKSTTKLPHNWSHIQAKEDETDSGIGSTDSTDYHDSTSDNFQEVLFNLKALNGAADVLETDRLDMRESQVSNTGVQNEKRSLPVSATIEHEKNKNEDQDLLDQINDIVNEGKTNASHTDHVTGSGQNKDVTVAPTSFPTTDEDEDMVMIIGDNTKEEDSKELIPKDKNGAGASKKHPLRIGDKVRSTVHSIMSKLVQSGSPEVSSLLNKVKTDDCVETASSPEAPSVPLARLDKGNLFDNLDFDISDKESKLSKLKAESLSGDEKSVPSEKDCKRLSALSSNNDEKACSSPHKQRNDIAEVSNNSLSKSETDILNSSDFSANPKDNSSLGDQNLLTQSTSADRVSDLNVDISDEKTNSVTKCDDSEGPEQEPDRRSNSCQENQNSCDASGSGSQCADSDIEKILPENACESSECERKDMLQKEKENEQKCLDTSQQSHDQDNNKDNDNEKEHERKRQHEKKESESDSSQPAKRSRLDLMIGKLGERISIPPESVESESLDCEDSNMEDSESAEKHSEEVSVSASDDEDDRTSLSSPKTLRLTSKELDSVVRSKVKAYLARQQGAELRVINARIQELMKSEEDWRNKAKDFERKLTELTLKQHKLEKRKAHTAALRSITTRNIGVQVNEEKLKANTPQKMPKSVPSGNGTPLSSVASPPSPVPALMLSSLPGQPKILTPVSCTSPPSKVTTITIGQNFGNRNTSVAQLLSQTARMPTAATSVSSSSKPASVPSSNGPRQPSTLVPASNASVRSLLDQASSLSKVTTSNTISPTNLVFVNTSPGMPLVSKGMASGTVAGSAILTAATGVTTNPSNIKVIDLTMEDDGSAAKQGAKQMQVVASSGQMHNLMPQQMVRQITPITQGIQGPTSAILFSSSAGTQIVTAPNMPRPSGMIQVVTIANAAPLRPGSLLTVVSGQPALVRQPSPSTTNVSRSQTPQILAQPPSAMTIMRPAQVLGLSTTVRPSLTTSTTTTTARMPVVATGFISSSTAPVATQDANVPSKAKIRHPAPLPAAVTYHLPNETKPPPPQPGLKISRVKQGIVLSWNMTIPKDCVEIASYQLFAYQETSAPPSTSLWKKVGDVKALPLPMACTLTQFQDGNKYHFAVRAVDIHGRTSNFSDPAFIFLSKTS